MTVPEPQSIHMTRLIVLSIDSPTVSSCSGSSKPKSSSSVAKPDKTAVFESIRGDRPQLKKTETNDRSAPKLD